MMSIFFIIKKENQQKGKVEAPRKGFKVIQVSYFCL